MRLFTGIALPMQASAPIVSLTDRLRPLAKLAWTPEAKLHITTKFIGEWPEARLIELQQALAAVASEPVDIHIARVGWLPNPRFPLSFYAGVELTGNLAQVTENALEPLGIAREKRSYHPHVTLGRVRRTTRESLDVLRAELQRVELDVAPFRAPAFYLYLSGGGTYTKLSEYPLPS
jgi:2'-5' RNA ligase